MLSERWEQYGTDTKVTDFESFLKYDKVSCTITSSFVAILNKFTFMYFLGELSIIRLKTGTALYSAESNFWWEVLIYFQLKAIFPPSM